MPDSELPPQPEPSDPAHPPATPEGDVEPSPLDLVDDTCPRCHASLAHEAVMCIACGYDLKANVIRKPEVGDVVDAPAAKPATKEFVSPGRGTPQVLATCGVFLTLAALIAAGVTARQWGAWVIMGSVALALYNIILHTCTGVVAVFVAAHLSEERFSRVEVAASRMFVAVSLFYAVSASRLPLPYEFLARGLPWVAALAVYFFIILILFKKDRMGAALIAIAHFLMWLTLQLGTHLAAWVASGQASVAPTGV